MARTHGSGQTFVNLRYPSEVEFSRVETVQALGGPKWAAEVGVSGVHYRPEAGRALQFVPPEPPRLSMSVSLVK